MASGRLLVIDDEADIARFIGTVAEGLGFQVTVTTEAEAFITAFNDEKPDVVVIDVVMPNIDGIELVKYLGQAECDARVLVISGFTERYLTNTKILGEAFGLGSVTAMKKPIEITQLEDYLTAAPAA